MMLGIRVLPLHILCAVAYVPCLKSCRGTDRIGFLFLHRYIFAWFTFRMCAGAMRLEMIYFLYLILPMSLRWTIIMSISTLVFLSRF